MSDIFVFSKILPSNSIINPNVQKEDYLDYNSPFSFFDYLKYTKIDLSPSEINNLYINYLKQWNEIKQNNANVVNDTIRQRYIDLIKEITVKYTTLEEKRFLAAVDFNDDLDLDIILPFYSQKIRDICNFYSEKREKIKYKTQKNKIKGTQNSVKNAMYENITDILFADAIEIEKNQKLVNYDELLKDLNIEVEELYDLYTSYLDNDPDKNYSDYNVKTKLRQDFYSANINKIDANLFIDFDTAVKNQLFENIRTFLTEFGRIFTINYDLNAVNLNCKPDDKLYKLVTDNKPYATRIARLRNALIKKYIGSDFYYITTGSTITDVASALLFKADNPTGNLLNRNFPTTASVEEESDIQSCRRIGLFFTPEKNSILYFSVPEKKYKIDTSKLKPNKLYIFPDPERYGNTTGLSQKFDKDYPLIHICEYTKSVKNYSWPGVEGDIESNPYNQDFYPYFSRNQLSDNIYIGYEGIKTNFSPLYNNGILTNWASDIYGNQYGLFKEKNREILKFEDNNIIINLSSIVSEEYDAGPITFFENGLLPDYMHSGNPSWVSPNVWASNYYYNILIEGGIGGIVNGLMERGMFLESFYVDGLVLDRNKIITESFDINLNPKDLDNYKTIDGELYNNTGSINFVYELNQNNNSMGSNTYDYIIEGNYFNRNPKNIIQSYKNVLDGQFETNASDFDPSFNYGYILSSVKYKDFDSGYISDIPTENYNFEDKINFIVNKVSNLSKTITSEKVDIPHKNSYELRNSVGSIYVKDAVTGLISPLLSALEVQFINKYPDTIIEEIRKEVLDFNVFKDIIWIRTKNYIIFENFTYQDNKFVYTGTGTNYIKYGNQSYLDNISNPFFFENRSYSMVVHLSATNIYSNDWSIIPILYKIDYITITKEKIFPFQNNDLLIFKNDSIKNKIKLNRINKPTLTYNSRNDMFCILSVVEDPNQFSYILEIKFKYDGINILNQTVKLYNLNGKEIFKTINFYDLPSLSGSNITFNDISLNNQKNFVDGALAFS